jgi:hypothetical protein
MTRLRFTSFGGQGVATPGIALSALHAAPHIATLLRATRQNKTTLENGGNE